MNNSQMPEKQEEVKLPECPNCGKVVKEIRWQGYGRVYLVVHNKCNTVIGATPILQLKCFINRCLKKIVVKRLRSKSHDTNL